MCSNNRREAHAKIQLNYSIILKRISQEGGYVYLLYKKLVTIDCCTVIMLKNHIIMFGRMYAGNDVSEQALGVNVAEEYVLYIFSYLDCFKQINFYK